MRSFVCAAISAAVVSADYHWGMGEHYGSYQATAGAPHHDSPHYPTDYAHHGIRNDDEVIEIPLSPYSDVSHTEEWHTTTGWKPYHDEIHDHVAHREEQHHSRTYIPDHSHQEEHRRSYPHAHEKAVHHHLAKHYSGKQKPTHHDFEEHRYLHEDPVVQHISEDHDLDKVEEAVEHIAVHKPVHHEYVTHEIVHHGDKHHVPQDWKLSDHEHHEALAHAIGKHEVYRREPVHHKDAYLEDEHHEVEHLEAILHEQEHHDVVHHEREYYHDEPIYRHYETAMHHEIFDDEPLYHEDFYHEHVPLEVHHEKDDHHYDQHHETILHDVIEEPIHHETAYFDSEHYYGPIIHDKRPYNNEEPENTFSDSEHYYGPVLHDKRPQHIEELVHQDHHHESVHHHEDRHSIPSDWEVPHHEPAHTEIVHELLGPERTLYEHDAEAHLEQDLPLHEEYGKHQDPVYYADHDDFQKHQWGDEVEHELHRRYRDHAEAIYRGDVPHEHFDEDDYEQWAETEDSHHGDRYEETQHIDRHAAEKFIRNNEFDSAHEVYPYGYFSEYDHAAHGQDYVHDSDYHKGAQLKTDIEHEFDELYHDLEQRTYHGVEHHDIDYTTHHGDRDAEFEKFL